MKLIAALFVAVALVSCAKAPPNLTPIAAQNWKQHEVQKDLDLVRDLAHDANAQVPPIVSENATRIITRWHETAITLVHNAPAGWKQTLLASLNDLKKNIPIDEYRVIERYVQLAIVAVQEIP